MCMAYRLSSNSGTATCLASPYPPPIRSSDCSSSGDLPLRTHLGPMEPADRHGRDHRARCQPLQCCFNQNWGGRCDKPGKPSLHRDARPSGRRLCLDGRPHRGRSQCLDRRRGVCCSGHHHRRVGGDWGQIDGHTKRDRLHYRSRQPGFTYGHKAPECAQQSRAKAAPPRPH